MATSVIFSLVNMGACLEPEEDHGPRVMAPAAVRTPAEDHTSINWSSKAPISRAQVLAMRREVRNTRIDYMLHASTFLM